MAEPRKDLIITDDVSELLGHYVYALRDPRDGAIFYVGKGVGGRVYSHVAGASKGNSRKKVRIREIQNEGLQVEHLFIRTGIADDAQAFMVEQAVIDVLRAAGLNPSNDQGGQHSETSGLSSVSDRVAQLAPERAPLFEPGTIVFVINKEWHRGISEKDLYRFTRASWVIGADTRKRARIALGAARGGIRSAYVIDDWTKVTTNDGKKPRWQFHGHVDEALTAKYVGKSVVGRLGKPGSQNPLRKFLNGETP